MAEDFSKVVSELKVQTVALNKLAGIEQQLAKQGEEIRNQGKDQRRIDAGNKAWQTRQENAQKSTAAATEDRRSEERRFGKLIDAVKKTKDGIMGLNSKFLGWTKEQTKKMSGNIFGVLKKLAWGAAITAAIALLNSKYWGDIKAFITDTAAPAVKSFYEKALVPVFDAIIGISSSFTNMLTDPSWENIKAFFGDAGTIALGIAGLVALLKTTTVFTGVTKAITGFVGLFLKNGDIAKGLDEQGKRMKGGRFLRGLRGGISRLMGAFSSVGTSLVDMATGTTKDADGKVRESGGKNSRGPKGRFAPTAARGAAGIAKGVARAIPGVGLIATAAFGIFDAVSAGLEEAKKETSTAGSIVKESVSGLLSGLTFGLVEQKTISDGITSIGTGITTAWNDASTAISTGATTLGTNISTAWTASKTAISTGITTISTKLDASFETAKTALTDGFQAVKDGINKVISDPEGAFNAATSKITELTGITLPDFQTVKTGITELGTSISNRATDIKNKFTEFTGIELPTFSIPTFADVKSRANSVFDTITNIELPEFTLPSFADLKEKANSLFDSITNIELPTFTLPEFPDIQSKVSELWSSIKIPEISFPDFANLNPFGKFDETLANSKAFDVLNLGSWLGGSLDLDLGDKLKNGLISLFDGKRFGGPVQRGGAYLVGEDGPELFVPRGSGFIIPSSNTFARTQAVANGSVERMPKQAAPIVINAPSSNTNIAGSRGGGGRIIPMNVTDNDPTFRAIAANSF